MRHTNSNTKGIHNPPWRRELVGRANLLLVPALLIGATLVGSIQCTPSSNQSTPEPVMPPSEPDRAASRAQPQIATQVTDQGVVVSVTAGGGPSAGVALRLELASGDEVSATTDAQGQAVITPPVDVVFRNVGRTRARVVGIGFAGDVDLASLFAAVERQYPAEWQQLQQQRLQRLAQIDEGVRFTGKVFRDKNEAAFVDTCTPSGTEQCFDAIDNDCDGRYDNLDCGYHSGSVQWTLTWQGDADLDLHVEGPNGEEVSVGAPVNPQSKLTLDRSCAGAGSSDPGCQGGNIENIFVPADDVPVSGTYQAWIEVNQAGTGGSKPLLARLAGRIGAKTWYTDVKLAPAFGATYRVAYAMGADADGDNVVDEHDACPAQPGCWFDAVEYRGCPDQDIDGVPDQADACPDKTGLSSNDPKRHGCPLVFGNAWTTNIGIKITERIEFTTGKDELRAPSTATVKNVAAAIKARPGTMTKLAIDGHTDNVGEETDNVALSHRRAQAVANALVKEGIGSDLLSVRGFGETQPLADNDSAQGRQANRRVEFVVVEPRQDKFKCW